MAFASRLLSRSKKFYGAQITLRHENDAVHSCVKKLATVPFPSKITDEILSITSRQRITDSSSIPFDSLLRKRFSSSGLDHHARRFSMMSNASDELFAVDNFSSFIKSAIDEHEGPNYFWLNKNEKHKELLKNGGAFIILVGVFFKDSVLNHHREHIIMFETVKSLQLRYPSLQIFGFQSGSSVCSLAARSKILKTVMEEYITFPILLSEKEFTEIPSEPCYLLFGDINRPRIHHRWDIEPGAIVEDLEGFNLSWSGNAFAIKDSSSIKSNHSEVIDEPNACSPFRNLLLYYPSCISADDHGNRLFLSDTNHHRIIVTDGDGQILDCKHFLSGAALLTASNAALDAPATPTGTYQTASFGVPNPPSTPGSIARSCLIGCSPGFEDGDFDSSKVLRPAGSVYHDGEDCLYFVDTENCAVRRADLGKRVLETLYPAVDKKVSGVWSWILDKLGVARKFNTEATESDKNLLSCPWHLMKSGEDELLVFSRSFETSWVMSMASGEIKKVHKGFSNIMEIHGQIIMERASLLKEIITDLEDPCQRIPYPGLISSVASLRHSIISCDAVGQRIFKYQMGSRGATSIQLSNFGVLGLPYWIPCPPENVAFSGNPYGEQMSDHLQRFSVLPGRCDIRVRVTIPEGTALAAPLLEGCVWRQARGAATEVSAPELAAASVDKVGAAQKWFDELDNLAFSSAPDGSTMQDQENGAAKNAVDSNSVHVDCAVNTSPGTSEVVISAVLYLKLKEAGGCLGSQVRESARRVLSLEEKSEHEACVDLLLESHEDVRDVVFMKPLRLRIRLDCGDHPPATTSKELLPTDCKLEVNVSLI